VSLQSSGNDDLVIDGELACTGCASTFPIREGIPRFVGSGDLEGLDRRFVGIYDRFSRLYPFLTELVFLAMGGARKRRKEVLDRLGPGGGRILEVSVGTGANLPYLLENPDVKEIHGLDISAGQIARCREAAARHAWPVELYLGTAEALPFKDESFDGVLHIGGINFLTHKKEAIEEMIRVARPGSKMMIADESERLARFLCRVPGLPPSRGTGKPDVTVPIDLVPDTMEDVRVDDIWKAHAHPHAYCLEFRKPG
jgi:ubiquinone/menaquinone biosynthesis C-methylase UbiE